MIRDPDEGGDDARDDFLARCDRGDACYCCGVSMTQIHTTGLEGLPLFGCPNCGAHSFPVPAEPMTGDLFAEVE